MNQSMSMAYHNTEQPQPPYEPEYVHGISQYWTAPASLWTRVCPWHITILNSPSPLMNQSMSMAYHNTEQPQPPYEPEYVHGISQYWTAPAPLWTRVCPWHITILNSPSPLMNQSMSMAYHNTEQPQPPYEPEYVHGISQYWTAPAPLWTRVCPWHITILNSPSPLMNQSMSMAYHNTEQPQPPYEPEYVHGISQYWTAPAPLWTRVCPWHITILNSPSPLMNQSMSMAYHNTEQPQPPYEPEYVHGISQYWTAPAPLWTRVCPWHITILNSPSPLMNQSMSMAYHNTEQPQPPYQPEYVHGISQYWTAPASLSTRVCPWHITILNSPSPLMNQSMSMAYHNTEQPQPPYQPEYVHGISQYWTAPAPLWTRVCPWHITDISSEYILCGVPNDFFIPACHSSDILGLQHFTWILTLLSVAYKHRQCCLEKLALLGQM